MDHSKKSTYLFSIDALRVVAILAVILIHSTTKTLQGLNHDVTVATFSLFLNQASRFAVPLFFLISGFVLELNNHQQSYKTFFRKRASRVFIPFIFWSALYLYIGGGFDPSKVVDLKFISSLIHGNASYHLYFIPALIIFYLMFPTLHKAIGILQKPLVLFNIIFLQIILLYYDYYIGKLPLNENLRIVMLFFVMFVVGMIASNSKEKILLFVKRNFLILLTLLIVLIPTIFLNVYVLTVGQDTTRYIYNQHSSLNYFYTLILSSVLFFLFEKAQFFKKRFILLSKLSFFVFFIHVLILNLIWDSLVKNLIFTQGNLFLENLWFDPLFFICITLISFGIAYISHQIPFLSKITG